MATCPICKSAALEIETGLFDGKAFRCPKHDEVGVAGAVLSMPAHMNAGPDQWEAALKRASDRTVRGAWPRILTYDF